MEAAAADRPVKAAGCGSVGRMTTGTSFTPREAYTSVCTGSVDEGQLVQDSVARQVVLDSSSIVAAE